MSIEGTIPREDEKEEESAVVTVNKEVHCRVMEETKKGMESTGITRVLWTLRLSKVFDREMSHGQSKFTIYDAFY